MLKRVVAELGVDRVMVLLVTTFLETANDPKRNYLTAVYKDLVERVKNTNTPSGIVSLQDLPKLKDYELLCYKQLDA